MWRNRPEARRSGIRPPFSPSPLLPFCRLPRRRVLCPAASVATGLLFALAGCNSTNMWTGSKLKPLEKSAMFPDGNSSRPILDDTVAREQVVSGTPLYTGTMGGRPVTTFPLPVTRPLLLRGQQRFNIYCAPCHGRAGDGRGMIVRRGFSPPPSYHIDRLRSAPVGHFFDVITNGFGAMYSYGDRVKPVDRWAIIAYIRALQLSQHAAPSDAPPNALASLAASGPSAPNSRGAEPPPPELGVGSQPRRGAHARHRSEGVGRSEGLGRGAGARK